MADPALVRLLARGPEAWNRERPSRPVDLSHLQVRNADFRGADFHEADFDGSTFYGIDARGADFRRARLNGVSLQCALMDDASFSDVELKGADFKHVSLRRCKFCRCSIFDLKVRHSRLSDLQLSSCVLQFLHVYNSDLRGAKLKSSEVRGAVFKRVHVDPSTMADLVACGCVFELPGATNARDWVAWDSFSTAAPDLEYGILVHRGTAFWISDKRYDFFISHAAPEKELVARPLAHALARLDARVWFDDLKALPNDHLPDVLSFGMRSALFGVAVISPSFFGRRWTEFELDMLEGKTLYLVLHDMTMEDLAAYRPGLRDKLSLPSALGADVLASRLREASSVPRYQH